MWRTPGAAEISSTEVITKEMSPGCWSESLRIAAPGYAVLVPGKSGAATTKPPSARSRRSGAYAAASIAYPCANTINGNGPTAGCTTPPFCAVGGALDG